MKIALIPLDDRPCNLKYSQKLASSANIGIISPPQKILGNFLKPGKPKEISKWLFDNAKKADAFIISIDMLAYGGLIASRKLDVSYQDAISNLRVISQIKKNNASAKIYLFNIVTRTSITVDSKYSEKQWRNIFRYLELSGKNRSLINSSEKRELNELKKAIPKKMLRDYFSVRERNHGISKEALKFIKNGSADFIVFGKEDCSKYGPQKKEAEVLKRLINKDSLNDNAIILNGADEIASMLVSKYYLTFKKKAPKIAVKYSQNPKNKISLYEDESVMKVIKDHIKVLEGRLVSSKSSADFILFVNMFSERQRDILFENNYKRNKNELEVLQTFCSQITKAQMAGEKVAVVDIAYANGVDPEFMGLLLNKMDLSLIHSYAGWNTSGNTIGSALAQAVLPFNIEFLVERFIDDLGYQTIIRRKINSILDKKGIDKYNLGPNWGKIEKIVKSELVEWAKIFLKKINIPNYSLNIALPWPRTFEIDYDIIIS